MSGIPAELLGTLGPTALAGLAVLMVLSGRLIPRSTHDAVVADLRQTIEVERERGRLLLEQNGELLEHARTTTAVITALSPAAGRERS